MALNFLESSRTSGLPSRFDPGEKKNLVFAPYVRQAILGLLDVKSEETIWEVGAGTGAVSISSAIRHPTSCYHAIERDREVFDILRQNISRLNTRNIIPHIATAPGVFAGLPDPDKVFIGGTGGRTTPIFKSLESYLQFGDEIVASFIKEENVKLAERSLKRLGYRGFWNVLAVPKDKFYRSGANSRSFKQVNLLKARRTS